MCKISDRGLEAGARSPDTFSESVSRFFLCLVGSAPLLRLDADLGLGGGSEVPVIFGAVQSSRTSTRGTCL